MGAWPLPGRSRVHAYVSIGNWNQDEPILPHTINSALPQLPLSRSTADARARIVATNLGFTTRAARGLIQRAIPHLRLRQPHAAVCPTRVCACGSGSGGVAARQSDPFEYRRHFLDLNAIYSGLPFASLRVGYGMEHDDREYRYLHETTDHVIRASAVPNTAPPCLHA